MLKKMYFFLLVFGLAHAYHNVYQNDFQEHIGYWDKQAHKLDWFAPWHTTVTWKAPDVQWFLGGKINASYNCLDRHIKNGLSDKVALICRSEYGNDEIYTYGKLHEQVCRFAQGLKKIGVKKGEFVALYMPMVAEAVVALLACARIGAPHMVIFGGIGSDGIYDRLKESKARYIITVDGTQRRGRVLTHKATIDKALSVGNNCVEKVIIVNKLGLSLSWNELRDVWYHDLLIHDSCECDPEWMDAEDLLFMLYTSGSTGKPKGIMHSTGGYLVGVYATFLMAFDIKSNDIFWSTSDIGWITGHSYAVYAPLLHGITTVLYDGAPDYPDKDCFWKLIEDHKITLFYTAPTAIRMFIKWGNEHIEKHDISSLRLLGSVGETINPEVWKWYDAIIGGGRCPIIDTWFQTETGCFVIAPIPGVTHLRPGSATRPLPGYDVAILDEQGNEVDKGFLAIKGPFPSMLRGIFGDYDRYKKTYWGKWDGRYYYTGDEAIRDADGYIWINGRLDDVLKISGHRIGCAEVENVIVEHPAVAEAVAVGIDDAIKGTELVVFVVLKEHAYTKDIENIIKYKVSSGIGVYARPLHVIVVDQFPKNHSGKIMRRLLRDLIAGRPLGDLTTLENPCVLDVIKERYDRVNMRGIDLVDFPLFI